MAKVRGRDTRPEMTVRRLLHKLGYRYRIHVRDLPGKPDIAFRRRRKVIFVHGCFWHGHPGCKRAREPQSNSHFWGKKLEANRRRDASQLQALRGAGWDALVVWECEIRDGERLADSLQGFLGPLSCSLTIKVSADQRGHFGEAD
jgi:DNA mismatch endonuclease (patch repair protein)